MEKEKLEELLIGLAEAIGSTIGHGLKSGVIKPPYERYFRWKVKEFDSETGQKKSAQGIEFSKPYWGQAIDDISQKVSSLSLYDKAVAKISTDYQLGEAASAHCLNTLINKISYNILERNIKSLSDINKYIVPFIKDLKGEQQKHIAEVKIRGILLQPRSIRLDNNVLLKKPARKDFEKEFSLRIPRNWHKPDPTAFLHISLYDKVDVGEINSLRALNRLQNEVDKVIAVFRLFRVGAVEYIEYSMYTDSIIHLDGGTVSKTRFLGFDNYLITRSDVKILRRFCSSMKNVDLPISILGEQKEPSELSIAYERYGDCLEEGIIEKRISSAVMGLEALYLGGGEQQEMGYRLRLRVSKLIGLLGYHPNEVSGKIKDAYEVRSKYVHGGTLKQKDRKKLEEKYGNLKEFSKDIMDYLRASIVALLKRPSKTRLIQEIDDSFLDINKEEEIKKLLFTPY